MKRIWIVKDEFMPSFPSCWYQSWGVSRSERTGRWTLYDRRDGREDEGELGTLTWASYDTVEAALALCEQSGYAPTELRDRMRPLLQGAAPSLQQLYDALEPLESSVK